MSRQEKLISRLLTVPKDFTWDELVKVVAFMATKNLQVVKQAVPEDGLLINKRTLLRFTNRIHPILLKDTRFGK